MLSLIRPKKTKNTKTKTKKTQYRRGGDREEQKGRGKRKGGGS